MHHIRILSDAKTKESYALVLDEPDPPTGRQTMTAIWRRRRDQARVAAATTAAVRHLDLESVVLTGSAGDRAKSGMTAQLSSAERDAERVRAILESDDDPEDAPPLAQYQDVALEDVAGQIAKISISHDGDYAFAVCMAAIEPSSGIASGDSGAHAP